MLAITEDAVEAIRLMADETGAEGLRISPSAHSMNGSGPALQIEPAAGPEVGDQVLDADGARVFLAVSTAALGDKVLDAEVEAGQIYFTLHQQD